jgi:hypothetical protein
VFRARALSCQSAREISARISGKLVYAPAKL